MTIEQITATVPGRISVATVRRRADRLAHWRHLPMLIDVLLAFLLTKVLFYSTALFAFAFVPEYSGSEYQIWHAPASRLLVDASWRWDSGWYAHIVEHGYSMGSGESSLAFFPLFPLLIKIAIAPVSPHWIYLAGVLVTNIALFFAMIAIWLYAADFGGRRIARRTLYLLAIFPASFFFSAAYSEAVFLLVAAWTLLFLRRGRFALAGMSGLLGALARPPGLYLAVPFVIEAWMQRTPDRRETARRAAFLLLIPAGLGIFMLYLWWRFGDPFLFLSAQGAWNHSREFPLSSLLRAMHQIVLRDGDRIHQLMNIVNTAASVLALGLGIVLLRRKRNLSGAVFVLIGVLAPLTFPIAGAPSISLARYVVVLFPMFIPLARWALRRSVLILLTLAFLPAQILLAALFIQWYWVI